MDGTMVAQLRVLHPAAGARLAAVVALAAAAIETRDRLAYSELMAIVLLIGAQGFFLDMAARIFYRLRMPDLTSGFSNRPPYRSA